jgi:hypothetical protein
MTQQKNALMRSKYTRYYGQVYHGTPSIYKCEVQITEDGVFYVDDYVRIYGYTTHPVPEEKHSYPYQNNDVKLYWVDYRYVL